MKQLLALLLSIFWFSSLHGQQNPVRFQHITAKNGLSQGHILCMIQDSEGYIWAGTYHGLNRYDGYTLDVFYAEDDNPNSLFINVVFSLYQSDDGKIWCGTWGIDVYDPLTETFEHIPAFEGPNSLSAGEVSRILEDGNGNMWFATQGGGLNKYHRKTGQMTVYSTKDSTGNPLSSDRVNDIVLDKNQILWIATEDGGLCRMDLPDDSLIVYRHKANDSTSIPSDKISALFIDRDEQLWLGDNFGNIAKYTYTNNYFETHPCCPDNMPVSYTHLRAHET